MLIPRFTIKVLLIVTAISAVVSYVLSQALKGGLEGIFHNGRFNNRQMAMAGVNPMPVGEVHGEAWAVALVMGLISVAIVFVLFVVVWGLAWMWEETVGNALKGRSPKGGNPFASAGPPRQIVPPSEPQ